MKIQQGASPSVSILIMIAVGLVIGVCTAAIVQGTGLGGRAIALLSGGAAVLVASFLRFKVMRGSHPGGAAEGSLVGTMVIYGLISTVAGGLAGHDIYNLFDARLPSLLGAIAGLLSVCVMSIAMITFHEDRRL